MGSEGDAKKISDSVGGLVWVRRRNGSWWPGRIMGLNELPQSCLLSPRSGTPVKLLGREDASVDWYNLEKSKRVKAFRCGEYDECIEKAKASAANPNKKAVKYARREDAILHALELEGPRESYENIGFQSRPASSSRKKQGSWVRKPKNVPSYDSEPDDVDDKQSMIDTTLTKELSQSGLTFEDPNHVSTTQAHMLQKTRRRTPNGSEDDGSEGTKRMRGLEDLGMGILSKCNASVDSDSEGSDMLLQQDSASFSDPNVSSSLSNGSPVNRRNNSCPYMRKRQPQVALGHENSKRKNRSRPLTKVLESTMLCVPVLCDQDASPGLSTLQGAEDTKVSTLESTDSEKASASVVNNNSNYVGTSCDREILLDASYTTGVDAEHIHSKPKGSDIITLLEFHENDGSDGLFDVPLVGEEKHPKDPPRKPQPGASCSVAEPVSLRSEGLDESGSTSPTVDVDSFTPVVENHTSKWQLKGKRNSRTHSHRANKHMDIRRFVGSNSEPDVSLTGQHRTYGSSKGFGCKNESNMFDEPLSFDKSVHWSSQVSEPSYLDPTNYGRRNSSSREGAVQSMDRKLNLSREKCVASELANHARNKELYLRDESVSTLMPPHRSLPYRQSRFTPHSKYQDGYVSSRCTFENSSLFDVNLEVRANYRGRHVPLVSLMSKLNGKAIVGHPITVEACEDGYCDLLLNRFDYLASSSGELYGIPENTDLSMDVTGGYARPVESRQAETGYVPSPVTHTSTKSSVFPKKSPKARKCGILSKKTRKLSSFVAPDQRDHDMKPVLEKLGGPVIACVPLNIVFSRINEALNGSARSTHRKSTLGNNP